MALTAAQKAEIRRYLGFSDINRVDSSFALLESAMSAVSAEGEALVVVLLGKLATIETELTNALGCLKASQVEDVRLRGPEQIRTLREEGRRLVGDLGVTLDTPPRRTPFSSARSMPVMRMG